MTARIIRFPTGQAQVEEEAPESDEPVPFLDWFYSEVVDFQSAVAALDEFVANDGEDVEGFWQEVDRLREQIDGWSPDG